MEANNPVTLIGTRLKAIRKKRSLSLEQTAELCGISKPMLSQIERGKSVPTITTLWKIATGLKVPFSSFLQEDRPVYTLVSPGRMEPVLEEEGTMRAWPLFAYDPQKNCEIFQIELDPGCLHESKAHEAGVEEYIFVQEGDFELLLQEEKIPLKAQEAIRFQADRFHGYRNPGKTLCRLYNVIFYPAAGRDGVL